MVRLALLLLDNNLWHDDVPLVMRGALALQIARRVGRHDHQRVGHAGGREVRSRLRIDCRSRASRARRLGRRRKNWIGQTIRRVAISRSTGRRRKPI